MSVNVLVPQAGAAASPLISVIIPVYQGEKLILGAVESVLNQTYRNLQVLVVDDGCTDSTLAVLETIADPRLRVLRQKNAGTAAARNLAIRESSGEFIAFLDSDDRWLPDKVARELDVLSRVDDRPAIVYSSYYPVDDSGRLLNFPKRHAHAGFVLDALLDGEDFLVPSVCLFDRRIFDRLGGFSVGQYHEDHEYILRAAREYPMFPTQKSLVIYRQSTSGKCRSILSDYERARREELMVVDAARQILMPDQHARLLKNAHRSLYCRFLMYGFNKNAKMALRDVKLSDLTGNMKGRLAWIFAKTGINLLVVVRIAIQWFYLCFMQREWQRKLAECGTRLRYE
jgi:glycosyltransferase involved in cell wall biosynthesis